MQSASGPSFRVAVSEKAFEVKSEARQGEASTIVSIALECLSNNPRDKNVAELCSYNQESLKTTSVTVKINNLLQKIENSGENKTFLLLGLMQSAIQQRAKKHIQTELNKSISDDIIYLRSFGSRLSSLTTVDEIKNEIHHLQILFACSKGIDNEAFDHALSNALAELSKHLLSSGGNGEVKEDDWVMVSPHQQLSIHELKEILSILEAGGTGNQLVNDKMVSLKSQIQEVISVDAKNKQLKVDENVKKEVLTTEETFLKSIDDS